ncbi:MAG TPA: tetratricopeptide repeat protein [Methylomirabilota bacterium]|nr:tetratricopeptide repeat protein [Methylomirabilota bacterium]
MTARPMTGLGRGLSRGLLVVGLLLAASAPALADGGGGNGTGGGASSPAGREDPLFRDGVQAIKAGDYPRAVRALESVVSRDGANADAYNWLAYATRQAGDPAKAIPLYQKALALNPKHRGAHEYIGEAYLALGNLAKAKEHLTTLDKLCFLPCGEHTDLKKAIQAYETSGGQARPTTKRTP